jgi:hypothetical protein
MAKDMGADRVSVFDRLEPRLQLATGSGPTMWSMGYLPGARLYLAILLWVQSGRPSGGGPDAAMEGGQ